MIGKLQEARATKGAVTLFRSLNMLITGLAPRGEGKP